MSRKAKQKIYMCDFETTVFKGQNFTEVWASACVEMNTEDVKIFHSIKEQYEFFKKQKTNIIAYYHNLKFDGSFWLSYLLIDLKYEQAYKEVDNKIVWKRDKDMLSNEVKYMITEMGQWYTITFTIGKYKVELRDSLKLLPFSVKRIGESFGTKHKKLDMDYEGFRYAGCEITDEEKRYIANDVLVVKEALEIMFKQGHEKLTIGSCCLEEFKNICDHSTNSILTYDEMLPNIYDIELDSTQYGYENAGEYIRKSYKGGWCYLVKGKENKIYKDGLTADVNSLYPSMMSSESGNKYPYGKPCFWKGNYIPDEAKDDNKYYFIRVKTRFYLKKDMLPFIQIKNNLLYESTECLESSDVYDSETGRYYTHYIGLNGKMTDTRIELTLTMTDYALIKEHYDLVDFEILDGCYFYAKAGIFDEYIEKYKKIKQKSKGAMRELAKLFLNNLYGKLASSINSSFKVAYIKDDESIGFYCVTEKEKKPVYIPMGSAITSYARNFTIRTAQKNYHGKTKRGFIYADTDSIHCDLKPDELVDVPVHDKNFCCWKLESYWDNGFFARQKTYIEHVTHEDSNKIDKPYYNVKCAGMPTRCKELFELSMTGNADIKGYTDKQTGNHKEWTEEEKEFLFDKQEKPIKRTIADFKIGLKVPDKLLPKRIKGGILLVNTTYEMR